MRILLLYITLIAVSVLLTDGSRADEIVLGVSATISGRFAPFNQGVSDGARLAAEKINERGGISGKKLRLIVNDDQCDPARAKQLTARMITQDKVVV
jgi:branched-chain amino acid transport system substrate-binding protein